MKKYNFYINYTLWALPLLFGVELKYRGNLGNACTKSALDDYLKLKRYKEEPYPPLYKDYAKEQKYYRWYNLFKNHFKFLSVIFFQVEDDYKKQCYVPLDTKDVYSGKIELEQQDNISTIAEMFDLIYFVSPSKVSAWKPKV